jgi:ABC-2 type transport system ATP-binding protein
MNSIIQVNDLTKKYGNVTAVDRVSFEVQKGQIFSLLGPNGAGKTTTISMLTTVSSITQGSATIAGYDVKTKPGSVRSCIGVLPQEVTLDIELKGIENLLFAARLHHVPESVARARARELFELVELENASEKRVSTYSGGMKRRLQLITALIHKPELLFLDEPTVGLDIQTRTKIWDYIRRLNENEGLSIFMTTHYLEEADYLSDSVAIMDHGRIKVSGSPTKLKDSLQGDILTLELADGASDLTSFLSKMESVKEVSRVGKVYRLKIPKVESALPEIISNINSRGLEIKETSFSKPSLDQVFLEVTGRSLRDAEEIGGNSNNNGHSTYRGDGSVAR